MIIKILITLILALVIYGMSKGYSLRDMFSSKKWKAVYVWLIKRHLNRLGETNKYLSKEELIQYAFRVASCSKCINAKDGNCKFCGCDVEGKLNDRLNGDDYAGWGPILSDEEMNDILKDYEIVFSKPKMKKRDE